MPSSSSSFWPQWNDQPVFTVLLILLLASGVLFAGAGAYKVFKESSHVGYSAQTSPSISVSADAKAVTKNDIATVDVGVTQIAKTASQAQAATIEKMNALSAAMKEVGIAEDDLQTSSYNVYPQYDYDQSPAVIVGYQADQTLTVKIRDSALVNAVLGKAGELGATNVGSLRFEADNTTDALNAARTEAIAKARAQAEATAQAMHVTLGDVISYSESTNDQGYPSYYRSVDMSSSMMSAPMPEVQMGQSEVHLYVYINYALK